MRIPKEERERERGVEERKPRRRVLKFDLEKKGQDERREGEEEEKSDSERGLGGG